MLTKEDGKSAVTLARSAIETYLETGEIIDSSEFNLSSIFKEKRGVFVTLKKDGDLRGCIGHPYPDSQLDSAIIDSSISAATHDPRFPSVESPEMNAITLEVTILSQPELVDVSPEELSEYVEVGKHGLIAKKGYSQGLLLPQVATEQGFDSSEFLSHTCLKAGLSPDEWKKGAQIYCFEGQIFTENTPGGDVSEEDFERACR
ncbi:TIGR00296 family protein [Methanohalobium sp.]|uniref:TIGR00296 family protein n=1 Tax=Methanohalobium sp. TaxID=2837493 RepID=UPI0025E3854C|nr:TIGR00296 family protein [Methanohalobium sp.]